MATIRRTEAHDASVHYPVVGKSRETFAPLSGWRREPPEPSGYRLSPYTREDELLDQLERLPSRNHIEDMVGQLNSRELRPWTIGILADNVEAAKARDLLGIARTINEWIATAEELRVGANKVRRILSYRRTTGED